MSSNNQLSLFTISDEAIAARAYEIWEARGCPEGDGADHWAAARAELEAQAAEQGQSSLIGRWLDRLRRRAALFS